MVKNIFLKLMVFVMFLSVMMISFPATGDASYSFTQSDFTRCFNAFMNNYYINAGDFKTSLTDSGAIHFWEAAFIRQLLADNYTLTGLNKDKISETYYRYENTHCADRFGNSKCWIANDSDWNDDYSWQAQFTMSAYAATGDQHLLDQAKWHFDYFYANNVDDTWGGGMWRERTVRNQKDVPTNGWGIVAAQLGKYYPNTTLHNNLTGADRTYLQMAQDTYNWIKTSFMRPDGGIENSFSSGNLGWDDNLYTYNAGIFIELAANLYDLTKDTSYLTDACKAADFAKAHFTTGASQIVVYEDDVGGNGLYRPDPTSSYEIVFKGILIRGIYKLIKLGGQTQYTDWLSNNAQAAYTNRSSSDLAASQWDTAFGSNARATGVASALTAMCYSLMTGNSQKLSGKIEGESGRKYGTAYNQADSYASGGYEAGSIDHVGSAVEFENCAASSQLTIRYCSALNNAKLSLYINGSHNQDVTFSNTGKWYGSGAYTEKTISVNIPDGATIKFQYDSGDVAANIDYIILNPASGVIFYQDADYDGTASKVFDKGTYTLAQLNAKGVPNDWMSSLKVPSGWTVIVYQDDNFSGTSWILTADIPYVGPDCNDKMSSCKIQ